MASGGGDDPTQRRVGNFFRRTKQVVHRRAHIRQEEPMHVDEPSPSTVPVSHAAEQMRERTQSVDPPAQRVLIVPEGNTFYPSKEPTHKIRDIIRSRFDHPYISWKKIPLDVRQMWFREFQKDFTWDPQQNEKVWNIFESKASSRLRDMFTDARKSGQRPAWIGEDIWAGLNAAWSTPEFTQKRVQAKQNRSSDGGSSLHTGGSIPHTEHSRRMARDLGRDPSVAELHRRTHRRQSDQNWVDDHAMEAGEAFIRRKEASQATPDQATGANPSTQESDFQIWKSVVGGKKKGRIYGLGSQGIAYEEQAAGSSTAANLQSIIDSRVDARVAQIEEQMNTRMARIEAEMAERFASRPDKGKSVVEDEDLADDDE